jgi:hypothetical protein
VLAAATLCPHPPLLFRELGGAVDPVAPLRSAVHRAVGELCSLSERVVVLGGADTAGSWDPGAPVDVRRFGTTGPRVRSGLPLSMGVGTRLLETAGWTGPVELRTVPWHAGRRELDAVATDLTGSTRPDRPGPATGVLLLADGSTRRGPTAPGYLDDRAFAFDDGVARALASGDAGTLRGLDPAAAEDLMVLGSAAFRLLGSLALLQDVEVRAELTYRDDPLGVSYFVASWRFGER